MPILPTLVRTPLHALATAGILAVAFGLPALMAAGGRATTDAALVLAPDRPMAHFQSAPQLSLHDLPMLADAPAEPSFAHAPNRTPGKAPAPPPPPEPVVAAAPPEPPVEVIGARVPSAAISAHIRRLPAGLRVARATVQERSEPKRARPSRRSRCDELVAGIDEVKHGHYTVQRDVIDHYTKLRVALKLAAVRWHKNEEGKTDGFSVYRIRCGNPLAQVGLRNGDVIHTINGRRVRSIPHALYVVARVKGKDRIQVVGSRRGNPLHITAEVI